MGRLDQSSSYSLILHNLGVVTCTAELIVLSFYGSNAWEVEMQFQLKMVPDPLSGQLQSLKGAKAGSGLTL